MIKFKEYLKEEVEFKDGGLTIFDIDDTLFHTTAQIGVVKDGKVIKTLTNQEYNHRDEFFRARYLFGFHCRSTQTSEGVKGRTRSRDLVSIEHHWISRGGTRIG